MHVRHCVASQAHHHGCKLLIIMVMCKTNPYYLCYVGALSKLACGPEVGVTPK